MRAVLAPIAWGVSHVTIAHRWCGVLRYGAFWPLKPTFYGPMSRVAAALEQVLAVGYNGAP